MSITAIQRIIEGCAVRKDFTAMRIIGAWREDM
jgi:hypothetical protein